jgi:hypothetical protein
MSDYIKKLAEQAGMEWETQSWCWLANPPHLEKFAELVRQDEREANAELLEALKLAQTIIGFGKEWDQIDAAIAKATGEQA